MEGEEKEKGEGGGEKNVRPLNLQLMAAATFRPGPGRHASLVSFTGVLRFFFVECLSDVRAGPRPAWVTACLPGRVRCRGEGFCVSKDLLKEICSFVRATDGGQLHTYTYIQSTSYVCPYVC